MIDFAEIKKYIYFPKKHERRNEPYIVHVLDKWGVEWRGHVDPAELAAKNFSYYAVNRCRPHSEELWNKCVEWIAERDLLEAKFKKLMNGGS